MPHKLRKIRKKRGSRTHGYGRVGQHRKTSSKGRRKVGRHKHLWSYVIRYEPDYFSKKGFVSHRSLGRKSNILNVEKLDEMANRISTGKEKDKPLIDLEKLGYAKLLGRGKITKAVVVKVASYSKSAAEKIKEAGGNILEEDGKQGE